MGRHQAAGALALYVCHGQAWSEVPRCSSLSTCAQGASCSVHTHHNGGEPQDGALRCAHCSPHAAAHTGALYYASDYHCLPRLLLDGATGCPPACPLAGLPTLLNIPSCPQVAWLGAWAILLGFRDYKDMWAGGRDGCCNGCLSVGLRCVKEECMCADGMGSRVPPDLTTRPSLPPHPSLPVQQALAGGPAALPAPHRGADAACV